jgi:hypothetical protein
MIVGDAEGIDPPKMGAIPDSCTTLVNPCTSENVGPRFRKHRGAPWAVRSGSQGLECPPAGGRVGRVERDVDRHPDEQRERVEKDRKADSERHPGGLQLQHAEIGPDEKSDDCRDCEQLGDHNIDCIGPKKVSSLIGVRDATRGAALHQREPTLKDASSSTIRAAPQHRSGHADDDASPRCFRYIDQAWFSLRLGHRGLARSLWLVARPNGFTCPEEWYIASRSPTCGEVNGIRPD